MLPWPSYPTNGVGRLGRWLGRLLSLTPYKGKACMGAIEGNPSPLISFRLIPKADSRRPLPL